MSKRGALFTIISVSALCGACIAEDEPPVDELEMEDEDEEMESDLPVEDDVAPERELLEPPEILDERDPEEALDRAADIGIVCMYGDWWYNGRELCFYVPRGTCGGVPDFRNYGFNDTASSIKVQDYVHAYLYKHGSYTGEYSSFFGSWDAWLGNNTVGNDQATSLWFCYW